MPPKRILAKPYKEDPAIAQIADNTNDQNAQIATNTNDQNANTNDQNAQIARRTERSALGLAMEEVQRHYSTVHLEKEIKEAETTICYLPMKKVF